MSALRKLFSSVALAAPMILAAPVAAHAALVDVVVVEGSGTIDPGLPCSPCTIDFTFTAVVAGDEAGVYAGCNFHGTSLSENELGGSGTGIITGCAASGTVTYNRTGVLVQVSGNVTVNGSPHSIATSALIFLPTSAQPTTSFIVAGAVVLA